MINVAAAIDSTGLRKVIEKLEKAGVKMQRKVVKRAMSEAIKPVIKTAKALAPIRTGALQKSLDGVTRLYKSGMVLGIVGARSRYWVADIGFKYTSRGKIQPSKYIHFVEYGVTGRRNGPVNVAAGDSQAFVPARLSSNYKILSAKDRAALSRSKRKEANRLINETRAFGKQGILRPALKLTSSAVLATFEAVIRQNYGEQLTPGEGGEK